MNAKSEVYFSYAAMDIKGITAEEKRRAADSGYVEPLHIAHEPVTTREFFHALGIYRDPRKAMG